MLICTTLYKSMGVRVWLLICFVLILGFLISPRQRSRDTDTEQEGGTEEEGEEEERGREGGGV